MVAKLHASRLRMALGGLLFINIIHFMMTATTTSTSDFVLAFLGYYGQDLMRPGALHIFFWLAIVSPVADLFVLLIELISIQVTWLNIFAIVLTVAEVVIKIAAAVFSRNLRNHLLSMPGQSV
jgi:ABC-type multidrug transport system permease subunit